jgi:hypothetical protein
MTAGIVHKCALMDTNGQGAVGLWPKINYGAHGEHGGATVTPPTAADDDVNGHERHEGHER